MPSYEKMAVAKYPSLGQERHGLPAPKPQSRLELMRSQYQKQLMREREEKMVTIYTQQQESALSKARTHSYHHPQSAQLDTQQAPGRQGFLSAGYNDRYNQPDLGSPGQTTASNWTAKKRSGVDRAYPLKPIFHRKAVSLNNIMAAEEARGQSQKPAPPAANPNSRISGTSPSTRGQHMGDSAFSPGLLALQKRSRSIPGRAEPWQKLEALGENLQEEIRRKETLLREKLRRTEEELRRIQREREQAEQEEQKEREGRERRRWAELGRSAAAAKIKSGNGFRNPVMVEDSSDNEEYEDSPVTRSRVDSRGDRPWMNTTAPPSYRPSPLLGTHEHGVERLKKERLVASNSKIRNKEPPPPSNQEPSAPPYPSESSSRHRPYPTGNGSHVSPSFREPDHRPEYRLSAPSTKQGTAPIRAATPPEPSDQEEEDTYWEQPCADEADSQLEPCHLCGRNFLAQRLEKHAAACRKMQNSKRKVFDSSKARAKGTDLEPYMYRKSNTTPAQEQQIRTKKGMWRQKHESFIRNIRQAREVQQIIAKGGKLSDLPPPPPDENPDYISCPHCSRRFAPKVAERHIPKCETIKSKPRPPPQRRR